MKLPFFPFGPRELNSQIAHHALHFLISLLKTWLAFPFSKRKRWKMNKPRLSQGNNFPCGSVIAVQTAMALLIFLVLETATEKQCAKPWEMRCTKYWQREERRLPALIPHQTGL